MDKKIKLGPVTKKVLIMLEAATVASMTARPSLILKAVREITRTEPKPISRRTLKRAIETLHRLQFVESKEKGDGNVTLLLTERGKKAVLRHNIGKLTVSKPDQWDGWWRMVIFDIPERLKMERMALAGKLRDLGFGALQKSVFIYPFDCSRELDFLIETLELRPYVRLVLAKETDVDFELKQWFGL